jgi:hypothetical protein
VNTEIAKTVAKKRLRKAAGMGGDGIEPPAISV